MIVVPRSRRRRTTSNSRPVSSVGECGGRLVHDDQPCIAREGAQDLDLLLVGDAQRADDERPAARLEADPLVEPGVAAAQRRPGRPSRPVLFSTPRNTFLEHEPWRTSGDLLRDDRHAASRSASRGELYEAHRSPSTQDLAVIRRWAPADDLAERRLARAVLADEAVDRAALDLEVDGSERVHAPEALVDPPRTTCSVPLCGCDAQASAPTGSAAADAAPPPRRLENARDRARAPRKTERSPGSSSRTMASKT